MALLESPSCLEAECLGVPVDRDDAKSELLRSEDRTALVAPGADEEHGRHVARCYPRV